MSHRFAGVEWALLAILFVLASLPTILTAGDYGPTYDEPHYASAGIRYADWWTRVFRADTTALQPSEIEKSWRLNHEHPPLQKCASGFAQRWFEPILPGVTAMRIPSAIWFALTACAIYLFTRGIWGRRGALFGALAFATMPRVFAHAHFMALDMPIACWFFITVALTATALRRNSWLYTAFAGIAFGLALLTKLNAFFLPLLLLPWGLSYHRNRWPKLLFSLLLIGPAVFLMGWPWLWIDLVPHLREYLAFHFGHAAYNVWYLGRLWQYAPWHYPFVMTAVTTPALVLALSILGMAYAWQRRSTAPSSLILLFGFAIAIIPNALPTSPKYNGIRLFLPALPFLASLAGGGFAILQGWITRLLRSSASNQARLGSLVTVALALILLIPSVRGLTRVHPYQLAYYNALIQGTQGATARGFETIYWGQIFQGAPPYLNSIEHPSPRVLVIPKGVIYLLEFQQQAGALRPDVQFTADEDTAPSADCVIFQAMQSDYTELCWALVNNIDPIYAIRLKDQTPILLAYDREAILAVSSNP